MSLSGILGSDLAIASPFRVHECASQLMEGLLRGDAARIRHHLLAASLAMAALILDPLAAVHRRVEEAGLDQAELV